MMAAGTASVQARSASALYGMDDARRDDGLLRNVVLDLHNGERESLGLASLQWDETLAADAQRYARTMARTGVFAHSNRANRSTPSGENLWMGTRGLYEYAAMIGGFLNEKRLLRRSGKLPDISTTGRWQDVGHYTQMIWRGTHKVGCALGEGAQFDYLVCRYFPAGNVFGQGPLDADSAVLAPGGR